jgi:hypothetical protein
MQMAHALVLLTLTVSCAHDTGQGTAQANQSTSALEARHWAQSQDATDKGVGIPSGGDADEAYLAAQCKAGESESCSMLAWLWEQSEGREARIQQIAALYEAG